MSLRFICALAALSCGILPAAPPKVLAITIDHVIHPITVEIVSRALEQAKQEHADALLIRLNTPGGMLDATRQIIEKLSASGVPVVTFVTPSGGRAASAGFFLLEAGDIAAMADGTNTGAASPVLLGQQMDPVMRQKVESDTAAGLRSLVARHHRNVEQAEKTVREAKSFTETEALRENLIDLIVHDEKQLLEKLDGSTGKLNLRGATVVEFPLSYREQIVSAISDPNIAFVLLVLGILGVYIEFNAPGLILPGVIGGISALLALSALSVFPVNWIGLALLLLAMTLFVLEAKFTSHGILGVGGAVAMVLGALLLIDGPPEVRIHLTTALGLSLPFAAITVFLATIAFRARENKVLTGKGTMINEIAVVRTPLDPEGRILLHGEYWTAVSATPVAVGAHVRVTAVQGLKLTVEPVS
ncbi:MAG: nodulation protein NfeD [Bryobacteraceae bacterium]